MPSEHTQVFVSIAANRINSCLTVLKNNEIAFAAGNMIAISTQKSRLRTVKGHSEKITCLTSVSLPSISNSEDVFKDFIISGSADKTCILWQFNEKEMAWKKHSSLEGHQASISAVAGLADVNGVTIATADSSNTVKIWHKNMKDESVVCVQTMNLAPHHCMAIALAHLPNSSTPVLFAGGSDMKLTFYAMQNNQFVRMASLAGHTDWIRSIKVAKFTDTQNDSYGFQSGDLMVATASQDKYIRIWKISAASSEPGTTESVLSLDAQMLDAMDTLMGTQLSTKAHIFETGTQKYSAMLDAILLGHDDWVFSINWQPVQSKLDANGFPIMHQPMCLVSSSADKSVLIWTPDIHSESWVARHRMGEVGGTTLGFYGAAFSNTGSTLFSNGYNGAIHIWEIKEEIWKPCIGLSGHSASVEDICWDPTGAFFLSSSLDQTSRIFGPWKETGTWHEISRSQIHGYNLQCCAFISKYIYVSGADEKVLRIFEGPKNFAQGLVSICGFEETEHVINDMPIGANLPALGLSNKAVLEGEEPQANHDARLSAYTAGALSSALTAIQTHPPFEEHLLQNTLWPEKEKLYGHGYEIISVGASPDGIMIASACKATKSEHAAIRLWCTKKWTMLCEPLLFHSLSVTCLSFSKSSKYLLTAGRDRSWAIFDLSKVGLEGQSWTLKQNCQKAHARIIWSSCFTSDDSAFATASRDKTIKIWALQAASQSYELIDTLKLEESVTAIDILSFKVDDCHVLAAGMEDGSILIFYFSIKDLKCVEIKKQSLLPHEQTHSKTVKSLKWRPAFGDNGLLYLASCSEDHSVRLFSIVS